MLRGGSWVLCACATILIVLSLVVSGYSQGPRLAVYLEANPSISAVEFEALGDYINKHSPILTGAVVCSPEDVIYAQRVTNTRIDDDTSIGQMRELTRILNCDYLIIFRVVSWGTNISFRPERSMLLLATTVFVEFLHNPMSFLLNPAVTLFGVDKRATVTIAATVYDPSGKAEYGIAVTHTDCPVLSVFTADLLTAAREAVDRILYQLTAIL